MVATEMMCSAESELFTVKPFTERVHHIILLNKSKVGLKNQLQKTFSTVLWCLKGE